MKDYPKTAKVELTKLELNDGVLSFGFECSVHVKDVDTHWWSEVVDWVVSLLASELYGRRFLSLLVKSDIRVWDDLRDERK